MVMFSANDVPPLELWGGIECTCNRVQDQYFDQFARSGHDRRPADLNRIAQLGIRTLRYPVLWEHVAPGRPDDRDWSWADDRLGRLRDLAIQPIVGLVHHGSGPAYTSLVEPSFATGLAQYAAAVAERYPWVENYTPVNEPLTTARFSTLYGIWYPHAHDPRQFAQAILNQCRATVLAMQAIRRVQPAARLVQTEDLGKVYSTARLAYQADFENERRWLTFDLLCGRVDRRHPLGHYFLWLGIREAELEWFRENPCPPDVLGVNYYVTSERFLDHRLESYPSHCHGGNGRHRYADVEAVRVRPEGLAGIGSLLVEASERYHLPLAVTEAHLGCYREEQLRWLADVWRQARSVREQGHSVLAVTAWSLLGAYDWNNLLQCSTGYYETGAFDVRSAPPKPTALAHQIAELAAGREPSHPVLAGPGWWQRPERMLGVHGNLTAEPAGRPILIAGATGKLGRAFARVCTGRGLAFRLLDRAAMDIASEQSVAEAIGEHNPWAIINAAGYVRVDRAERHPAQCFRENVLGPAVLAAACAKAGLPLVTFSSDLVFDGRRSTPYAESDLVNPLGVYGRSKVAAERRVASLHREALVIRTGALFGPWDSTNFVSFALEALAKGRTLPAADAVVSPTYLPDLVHATLDLLLDRETGLWHIAGEGETSWADLARATAKEAGLDPGAIIPRPLDQFGWAARRPPYSALGSQRGLKLPPWTDGLKRYFADRAGADPKELPAEDSQLAIAELARN